MSGAVGRFPGGGGAKINGIIERYKIQAGENISAGDFVDYVNKLPEGAADTYLSQITQNSAYISASMLQDGRVFIAFPNGTNQNLYGAVVTIGNNVITLDVTKVLSSAQNTGTYISTVTLLDGRVLVVHRYSGGSYHLYGMVVTINGNDISTGTDTSLRSGDSSGYSSSSLTLLNDGRVLVVYGQTTASKLAAILVSISGTTISIKSDTLIFSANCFGKSSTLLSNGDVFVAHTVATSVYGVVLSITGDTITYGSPTILANLTYSGDYTVDTVSLSRGRAVITYIKSERLYGIVISTDGLVITPGPETYINTVSGDASRVKLASLEKDRVYAAHSAGSSLCGTVLFIIDMIITAGADIELSDKATTMYPVRLLNRDIFIAHGSRTAVYGILNAIGVRKSIGNTGNMLGVTKTVDTNGLADVFVP